jgi:transcriptional regulator with XRE-family HTH domain
MSDLLPAWLREQRLARHWNKTEMGRQLHRAARATGDHTIPGVAMLASYVRRWEKGVAGPTERYLLHYCTAFAIPPEDFGPPGYTSQPADAPPPAPVNGASPCSALTVTITIALPPGVTADITSSSG